VRFLMIHYLDENATLDPAEDHTLCGFCPILQVRWIGGWDAA
jgi:hypothetical protein